MFADAEDMVMGMSPPPQKEQRPSTATNARASSSNIVILKNTSRQGTPEGAMLRSNTGIPRHSTAKNRW